jgi:homoserine dehydrogenase
MELVAVADSRSAAVNKRGLDPAILAARKKSTGCVGELQMNALEVIREIESDVVVEVTPGNPESGEPGLSHIREALKVKKSVVSANKMPLALHYSELVGAARRKGVKILYGACVGGGMPVLEMGKACAEAEPILGIDGILNATSNFILTKMEEEGTGYGFALAEAQRLGYAETDPTLDVRGYDAACKLVILANHVMGSKLSLKDVDPLEGIEGVSTEMLRKEAARGRAVRLVAKMHEAPEISVSAVDARGPLNVKGASSAVVFHCRDSGDRTIVGAGAGSITTSRAVLRDLIALTFTDRSQRSVR